MHHYQITRNVLAPNENRIETRRGQYDKANQDRKIYKHSQDIDETCP